MIAEYKRDLQHNYMILPLTGEKEENNYQLRMAENNQIKGLLPLHTLRLDGVLQIHYEITSRKPLDMIYEKKKMKYEDILSLLSLIKEALDGVQKYLLNASMLLFDPQFIYMDSAQEGIQLCFYPGEEETAPIHLLAEFILRKLDHEDRQAVMLGYRFYQASTENNFSLPLLIRDVLNELREEEQKEQEKEQWREIRSKEMMPDLADELSLDGSFEEDKPAQKKRRERKRQSTEKRNDRRKAKTEDKTLDSSPKRKNNFPIALLTFIINFLSFLICILLYYFSYISLITAGGIFFALLALSVLLTLLIQKRTGKSTKKAWADPDEEEYLKLQAQMYDLTPEPPLKREKEEAADDEEAEETQFLFQNEASEEASAYGLKLISRDGRYPDLILNRERMIIGKKLGDADLVLEEKSISRLHAAAEIQDEKVYIQDLNSKNGTFLNGERLMIREKKQLRPGDNVRFAEIEFIAEII